MHKETDATTTSTATKTSGGTNSYKEVFKRHRRKPDDPLFIDDLDEMVDFSAIDPTSDPRIIDFSFVERRTSSASTSASRANTQLQQHQYQGPIYGLKSHPGFLYIPSALSPTLQRDLAYQALTVFCQPPHGTNIDLVPLKPGIEIGNDDTNIHESMWELWKKDNMAINNNNNNNKMQTQKDKDKERHSANRKRYYKTFDKLSWATLGYRFDWTARAYREKNKSVMPKILDELGYYFAKIGEEVRVTNEENINEDGNGDSTNSNSSTKSTIDNYSFTASAAIVNYYTLKSSMGGHRDDSELALTKPVVSFSLGLPAVFMIGGKTKEGDPIPAVPLLLRPGDVMLLGGDSRLNYHGVARVLCEDVILPKVESLIGSRRISDFQITSWNSIFRNAGNNGGGGDNNSNGDIDVDMKTPHSEYKAIEQFLLHYRINVNARQVLPDGVNKIPGDNSVEEDDDDNVGGGDE